MHVTFRILATLTGCAAVFQPRRFRRWGKIDGGPAMPGRDHRDQGTRRPAGSADRRSPRPARPKGATMAKATDIRPATTDRDRSEAETDEIRRALVARLGELQAEYDQALSEITELQRERVIDSAGDDQADTGTKTLEREQEITLANNLLERINQVEHAIDRLGSGNYGWCERCGNQIPVERLAAFPSATLCVKCKQLEERR
ncbi:RNA polymerase-binding protein DksA [Actinoplanes couchii]|nr:RNA polymerase-binding protein DksA [Actinoplanes couchii]